MVVEATPTTHVLAVKNRFVANVRGPIFGIERHAPKRC